MSVSPAGSSSVTTTSSRLALPTVVTTSYSTVWPGSTSVLSEVFSIVSGGSSPGVFTVSSSRTGDTPSAEAVATFLIAAPVSTSESTVQV